jgi:hypothetical protein
VQARGGRVRRTWLWAIGAFILVLAAAAGAYAFGNASGEDLAAARANGRAKGQRAGAARGAEKGYRDGLARGKKQGYKAAVRQAKKKTLIGGQAEVAAAPVSRSCGNLVENGAGTYSISSVDVICDIARQVARQWEMQCASKPSGSCTVGAGFACSYKQVGEELGNITCTSGDRRVAFENGA